MKNSQQIKAWIDAFHKKGFTNEFISQRDSPGKFKELLEDHLSASKDHATGKIPDLWLCTYLNWNGENQSYIVCNMQMSFAKDNPVITKLTTEKKNGQAIPLKRSELTNVSIDSLPTVKELMESVDSPDHKKGKSHRL